MSRMQVWKVVIRPDPQEADLAQVFALAASESEVHAMVDHSDALVFWQHPRTPWPGEPDETLMWTSESPVMRSHRRLQ